MLSVGNNICINGNTTICCAQEINLGSNTLVSWDCIFMDTDFYKIYSANKEINQNTPIIIGENTWIGCRVSILKGCRIPAGSVIAAGSVVNKKRINNDCKKQQIKVLIYEDRFPC